jgi:TM2 domain-containing membrane protein YozV
MPIRWRGRQEGPYPLSEIERKLAANEIGMLHEVFDTGRWVTLREFFAGQDAKRRAQEAEQKRQREEAEREAQARAEKLETLKLAELKRRNDLLEEQSRVASLALPSETTTGNRALGMVGVARPPKSRVIYIVLGLLLGGLGIHNFYAGYTARGFIQLLVTLSSVVLVFPWILVLVWVIAEIITVKEDADKIPFQ